MECQLAPGANLREYPAQEYPVQRKTSQCKTRHVASAIPNLGRGGASSPKTASCCLQRALLTPKHVMPIPGHSIAAVRALLTELRAAC